MRDRRFRVIALLTALALFGLGGILLVAIWRLGRVGGWDADDGTM